jgi:cyclophilin family peptidyl-prolyl cis-trans isomerase
MRSYVRAAFAVCLAMIVSPAPAAEPAGFSLIPVEGELAQYWTRWRGPSGQGVANDGPYLDSWSPTENIVWKVEVPGAGNSSPIVFRDRIYLTTALDNGKLRAILCLNRADGNEVWRATIPSATPERVGFKNNHASPTPSTDGERVYAYFGSAGLLCVDLNGRQVWHRSIGAVETRHGAGGTPLLHRDKLLMYQERNKGSFVAAFDKRTGDKLWETPRTQAVGWGSPVVVRANGREELIVSSEYRVYSYDPESGKELWTCGGSTDEVTPTPVVGHGLLFCASGRAGPTLAILAGGTGDITETHVAWRAQKGSPFIPSPLLYGDYLYMVNDMLALVTCYEAKSGKLIWQERIGKPTKEGFTASPVGVNGRVFFTNDEGETTVLKAGPAFQVIRVNRIGERTLASPALCEGRWYIRTAKHLVCIGRTDPKVTVVIRTDLGAIDIELEPAKAPATVANFLRYIDAKYYDGGVFHRTVTPENQPKNKVKIEVIQAGVNPAKAKDEFPPIKLERTRDTGVSHLDGAISMARDGPDTATGDFFICIGDQPELNFGGTRNADGQGFAAFGRVTRGMDIVKKIQVSPAKGQTLTPPVKILGIERK